MDKVKRLKLRTGWFAVLAALLALSVAACGSDTESASSSGGGGGGGGGGGEGGVAAEVSKAEQFVEKYSTAPTELGVTQKLKTAPEQGKTFTWLQCDASQCKTITDALREATAAAGWRLRVINFKLGNPASLTAAMKQSLQDKPVAVAFVAVPYAVWTGQVPAFKKAGVTLIPASLGPAPLDDTVVGNINGPKDSTLAAQIVANWFIADSKGKGKAVLYGVPDLPALTVWEKVFRDTVKEGCSGCRVSYVTTNIPDALGGKSNSLIVSALRKEPDAKYAILSNYPLTTGLPSSLKAAGLRDIKIGGSYAGRADQALIKQGEETAATPQPLAMIGWLMVDAAARHKQDLPVEDGNGGLPVQLVTTETVGTPTDSYDKPDDYRERFKALWNRG